MKIARGLGRLLVVASVVVGVLAMHGLTDVSQTGHSHRTSPAGAVLNDANHVPGDTSDQHTGHLADACLWIVVAGLGLVGVAYGRRYAVTRAGSRVPAVPHATAGSRAGPAPPARRSHLQLSVLLR